MTDIRSFAPSIPTVKEPFVPKGHPQEATQRKKCLHNGNCGGSEDSNRGSICISQRELCKASAECIQCDERPDLTGVKGHRSGADETGF
jgi:hypothetical protein